MVGNYYDPRKLSNELSALSCLIQIIVDHATEALESGDEEKMRKALKTAKDVAQIAMNALIGISKKLDEKAGD